MKWCAWLRSIPNWIADDSASTLPRLVALLFILPMFRLASSPSLFSIFPFFPYFFFLFPFFFFFFCSFSCKYIYIFYILQMARMIKSRLWPESRYDIVVGWFSDDVDSMDDQRPRRRRFRIKQVWKGGGHLIVVPSCLVRSNREASE